MYKYIYIYIAVCVCVCEVASIFFLPILYAHARHGGEITYAQHGLTATGQQWAPHKLSVLARTAGCCCFVVVHGPHHMHVAASAISAASIRTSMCMKSAHALSHALFMCVCVCVRIFNSYIHMTRLFEDKYVYNI